MAICWTSSLTWDRRTIRARRNAVRIVPIVPIVNKVEPDRMIIVPVGQKEREAIVIESQSLTDRLKRVLGYTLKQ